MPQFCTICLSLSVTRPGLSFTQQNRVPSVSTSTPPPMAACHPHYYSERKRKEPLNGRRWKREKRGTQAAAEHSWWTFTVHRPVCVCTCVCVGMTSQACQADGVPKVGQEERCSICCLARVNIMAHWPTSCRHCALSHRDAKTRSTRRSSRFAVRVICSDSRWSVLIFEPSVY